MIERLVAEAEQRLGRGLAEGLQIVGPAALTAVPFDPGWPLLIVTEVGQPSRVAPPLPGRTVHARDGSTLLAALYPADHPALGLAGAADTTVGDLTVERLGAGAYALPALVGEADLASPHGLPWLAARLRAPDGCPWDRAQTHQSLRKHLLEEAYEVYDALEAGSTPALAGELGDLLLQVVLHAQQAAEAGVFDLSDVYRAIDAKIVRRHPHVFGSAEADSVDQVLRNWERIKADERADKDPDPQAPADPTMPAAFAGLSRTLPALAYSQEMQERAASLGYDWPDVEGVIDKVEEEAVELLEAATPEARREEFGDLLMVLVNLARRLDIDAEGALRAASQKFAARFAIVERLARADGEALGDLSPERLDALWRQAKVRATEEDIR